MTDSLDPVVAGMETGVLPFEAAVAYGRDVDRGIARAWRATRSRARVAELLYPMSAHDLAILLRAAAATLQLAVPYLDPPALRKEMRSTLHAVLRGATVDWVEYDTAAASLDDVRHADHEAIRAAFRPLPVIYTQVRRRDRSYAWHLLCDVVVYTAEVLGYPRGYSNVAEVEARMAVQLVKRLPPPTAAMLGIGR